MDFIQSDLPYTYYSPFGASWGVQVGMGRYEILMVW